MKSLLLLLSALLAAIAAQAQPPNDTTAIKKLLEKESATWRSGDVKGHAACWHIQPYSKIIISTSGGKVLDIPASVMTNPPAGTMGKGGNAVNTNYSISIHGNSAWVGHNETSTASDGTQSYSYEIRMLEKIKGAWKLVGQSIHSYKPGEQPGVVN